MKSLRRWLVEKYEIHWNSQNLNKHQSSGVYGAKWRHGRGWMHLTPIKTFIGLEWSILRKNSLTATLCLNDRGETEIMLTLGLPKLFTVYFTIENHSFLKRVLPGKWTNSARNPGEKFWMPVDRKMGINYHDDTIWISVWENPMEWSSWDPWWWAFNLNVKRLLLGKSKYSKAVLESGNVTIGFPEGSYNVKYTKELATWKRPRGKTNRVVRYKLNMDDAPIPVPGKGEESWDLDENAIYSSTISAQTLQEALGKLTQSVYRSRFNYGGLHWRPERAEAEV